MTSKPDFKLNQGIPAMQHLFRCFGRIGLAILLSAVVSNARAAEDSAKILGNIAVMEAGRVKPLDTVARHEVKQIFGRETIKLTGTDGKEIKWGPVAAFIDWQMPTRDEFWDNQAFILAEFVPLKEQILAEPIKSAIKAAIEDSATDAIAKIALETLAKEAVITHDQLKTLLETAKLPETHKGSLSEQLKKLGVGSKWVSPKDLEAAKVTVDGQTISFEDWFRNLMRKKSGGGMGGSEVKLSELENRAYEAGGRFVHYKAIRDRRGIGRMPVYTAIPRPSSEAYIKFSASAMKKVIEGGESALSPLERDTAEALQTYFEDIPKSDRAMPGSQAEFDKKFAAWLATRSQWIPLFALIESEDTQLAEAGFDTIKAKAVRESFRKIEAESQNGAISVATASEFAGSMRQLGEQAGKYPSVSSLTRESHFNSFAPFFHCPELYGTGLFFLLFSLVFSGIGQTRPGFFRTAGKVTYAIGLLGFVSGIILEIYGFYLRVMISGWAPVTNMYETVIWVALISAVIGLALELIYKRIYAATAATGVAMLATLMAANVSLLDPEIKSLQPVLRSNYWLTIHVLTIVSSYAAFALALGLGFIATIYYLTATYRRSPGFLQLMMPGLVGMPIMALGYLALTGSLGSISSTGNAYMASFGITEIGLVMTVASVSAVIGEAIARLLFRSYVLNPTVAVAEHQEEQIGERTDAEEMDSLTRASEIMYLKTAESSATAVIEPPAKVAKIDTGHLLKQVREESTKPVVPSSPRDRSMMDTAAKIKPLSNFIYRSMQVGVLLVAAGTILGGVWADYSWGRFWGWDPKEVWALIVLLVYLIPLHGRFAGWFNTFALVASSVVCFLSVMMAWYGVNFILGVGLHSYGFVEGGSQGVVMTACAAVCGIVGGAYWRRSLGNQIA